MGGIRQKSYFAGNELILEEIKHAEPLQKFIFLRNSDIEYRMKGNIPLQLFYLCYVYYFLYKRCKVVSETLEIIFKKNYDPSCVNFYPSGHGKNLLSKKVH